MLILGLCGSSGSGKSRLCLEFSALGVPCIDTDAVYRSITSWKSPCVTELCEAFGSDIITESGALCRKRLAELVFFGDGCDERRITLNRISHKHVLNKVREMIAEYAKLGKPAVVVDAPLLFESGFDRECDKIIAVTADYDMKLSRIMLRDGIDEGAARARLDSQLPDEYLIGRADFTVNNTADGDELRRHAMEILKKLNL